MTQTWKIAAMFFTMIIGKASIITLLSRAFGVPLVSALQAGLLGSQGGELALVAFGIAERTGLLPQQLCKLLVTTVALSMAATPVLADIGARVASKIEQDWGKAAARLAVVSQTAYDDLRRY